jgi:hypothetical protein
MSGESGQGRFSERMKRSEIRNGERCVTARRLAALMCAIVERNGGCTAVTEGMLRMTRGEREQQKTAIGKAVQRGQQW